MVRYQTLSSARVAAATVRNIVTVLLTQGFQWFHRCWNQEALPRWEPNTATASTPISGAWLIRTQTAWPAAT